MTNIEIPTVLLEELKNIAPEMVLSRLDPHADLREALDIDSIDFLNLVTALHYRLAVEIPEIDYPKLRTLNSAVAYLQAKLHQKPAAQ